MKDSLVSLITFIFKNLPLNPISCPRFLAETGQQPRMHSSPSGVKEWPEGNGLSTAMEVGKTQKMSPCAGDEKK